MSKSPFDRGVPIIEGPTVLTTFETNLVLSQGSATITFTTVEDFMEFVSRLGVVAVRLAQVMEEREKSDTTPE